MGDSAGAFDFGLGVLIGFFSATRTLGDSCEFAGIFLRVIIMNFTLKNVIAELKKFRSEKCDRFNASELAQLDQIINGLQEESDLQPNLNKNISIRRALEIIGTETIKTIVSETIRRIFGVE